VAHVSRPEPIQFPKPENVSKPAFPTRCVANPNGLYHSLALTDENPFDRSSRRRLACNRQCGRHSRSVRLSYLKRTVGGDAFAYCAGSEKASSRGVFRQFEAGIVISISRTTVAVAAAGSGEKEKGQARTAWEGKGRKHGAGGRSWSRAASTLFRGQVTSIRFVVEEDWRCLRSRRADIQMAHC